MKQRVLAVCRGRLGFALCDLAGRRGQRCAFNEIGQRPVLGLTEIGFPACIQNGLSLGCKGVPTAGDLGNRVRADVLAADGDQHLTAKQLQDLALSDGQRVKIRFARANGWKERVVVADLFAIANLRRVHGRGQIRAADAACTAHDGRDRGQHIVSQKAAVGSGIGTELLFIKRLQTIQRLLRRVAEQPVCVALERGQIIKRRGFLALFLPVELGNDGVLAFAGVKRRVRVGFILEFLADSRKIREGQRCRVVALGLERTNFRVTTDDERQRRRHHTPDVQRAMIQNRKQPRGVDAHQPVCLGAAERRVV